MELKDIVAIAGQSGLHKIVGKSKNGLIVETIGTGRRFATSFQDKVSVLEDISMYTADEDLRMNKVLLKLHEDGKVPAAKEDVKKLREYLVDTIRLDSERVYDSDVKKLINWYHALKNELDFSTLEDAPEADAAAEEDHTTTETRAPKKAKVKAEAGDDAHEEAKPKKAAAKKAATPKKAAAPKNAPKANTKGAGGTKTTYRSKTV